MALKTSHLFLIILWLSLFLLFFHELYIYKSKISNITTLSSLSRHPPIGRKVLASKFDFTPFLKHRHHHHHQKHSPEMNGQPEPAGSEIDPRYGVEKRLVPTGPNPLHH
ncbi:CLAVATA3/ESR (CLE)-related protein 13 [Camellia lanceoleosa]|uniref:CLAVATA3/ESR (CLE)-related protein 13 n=1 Tax=Camellia lanceoleosa TaxID=1840588 RepID=A0ACC0IG93_9ERIC|nr:CLAVATA3/ESR (CLE)-related protein 13 [Camellia lanceoleosa]